MAAVKPRQLRSYQPPTIGGACNIDSSAIMLRARVTHLLPLQFQQPLLCRVLTPTKRFFGHELSGRVKCTPSNGRTATTTPYVTLTFVPPVSLCPLVCTLLGRGTYPRLLEHAGPIHQAVAMTNHQQGSAITDDEEPSLPPGTRWICMGHHKVSFQEIISGWG